jgi:outer membrane biosynthesis protein TonB
MAKRLDRAFELAFFIHGDLETAKQIAYSAMRKLEVTSNAQFKRYYYTPQSRQSRNKVTMNDLQLLQRLVYVESEPFEHEKEFTETATEKDLLIYFVKHLIRITLKRNSFYVTLGLSRILHNYGTTETMEIYNILTQDPDRVQDDCYYRARKKVLMGELKSRFGEKLEITQAKKGEQRFQAVETSPEHTKFVKECLKTFVPWNTKFDFPDKYDQFSDTITGLYFNGKNPDDEHRVELNRMHVLLNPETFQKLVNTLHFPAPEDKLEIPKFNMKKKEKKSDDDNWNTPPSLETLDKERLKELLEQDAELRKSAAGNVLRILVDGEQRALFEPSRQHSKDIKLDFERDEFIEVYSVDGGTDTLLATYLLGGDDVLQETAITLEGGQKVTFDFTKNGCRVRLEQTSWLKKFVAWWEAKSIVLKPAFASLAILLFGLFGFIAYQRMNVETPQVVQKEEQKPIESPSNSPNIVVPPIIKGDEPKQVETPKDVANNQPKPVLKKEIIAPKAIEKSQPKRVENKLIVPTNTDVAEVQRFAIEENDGTKETITLRNIPNSNKSLKNIKTLYLEITGDEKSAEQIRQNLNNQLNKRFTTVETRENADGLLKISVKSENQKVSATVQIINPKGKTVYPNRPKTWGWKYVGEAEKVSNQIVKDLLKQ